MPLMLLVVACYTICSLSDKYAVAKLKFNGNVLTFLMAAATSLFMLFYLPFDSCLFTMSWQSFAAILLMVVSKWFEFQLAAVILQEMSAFELKAWLGLSLFLSYVTDLIRGISDLGLNTVWKFGFIAVTAAGLFLIAKSGGKPQSQKQGMDSAQKGTAVKKINYKKIALPLLCYILAKYGYGLIVNLTKDYISPTLSLFCALVILAIVLAFMVHPIKLFKEKTKGAMFVSLTKIPNVIGLVCENIVAAQSMANYSFIQPMILVVLFFIGLIKREECTKLNIAGGLICIVGIVGFQLL